MNKAFTKEDDGKEVPEYYSRFTPLPEGFENLITQDGHFKIKAELESLRQSREALDPEATEFKKLQLQIADIENRLASHKVVESKQGKKERIEFGATVIVKDEDGKNLKYKLVGIDESNPSEGLINWTSPVANALMNQNIGAIVTFKTPKGDTELEIIAIK